MSNLATADSVLALDRFQNSPDRKACQANPAHGTLFPHASGAYFTCGYRGCEYVEPVSSELLSRASALK